MPKKKKLSKIAQSGHTASQLRLKNLRLKNGSKKFHKKLVSFLPNQMRQEDFQPLSSVTRFGEILPIGQDFGCLWQNFKCLICIWQILNLLCHLKFAFRPFYFVVKQPNFEQVIQPSGYTAFEVPDLSKWFNVGKQNNGQVAQLVEWSLLTPVANLINI